MVPCAASRLRLGSSRLLLPSLLEVRDEPSYALSPDLGAAEGPVDPSQVPLAIEGRKAGEEGRGLVTIVHSGGAGQRPPKAGHPSSRQRRPRTRSQTEI